MLLFETIPLVEVLKVWEAVLTARDGGNESLWDSVGSIAGGLSKIGEAGINTDTSKLPGDIVPCGIVIVGTDKIGKDTGTTPKEFGLVVCICDNVNVDNTSEGIVFSTRLPLSENDSSDLFELIEAVVFVIFEATEFFELDEESEFTEPLLTVLSGGCSFSVWISVSDSVWVDGMNFSGSNAWN